MRFLLRLPLLSHSRHRWTLEQWARGNQARVARDRTELANVTTQQACPRCGNTDHTSANCPHSDKTCRKCGNVGHLASVCRSSGTPQPKAKGGQKGKGGGKSANAVKKCWNCGESEHMSSQCSKKKVHAEEESSTTASQAGSQDTILVGSIGSYFDVGSVSEVTLEPRGADEKICSMSAPNVCEGESVDNEIDSGAEERWRRHVPTARDEAQHVWRSPRCGWWRQTA